MVIRRVVRDLAVWNSESAAAPVPPVAA